VPVPLGAVPVSGAPFITDGPCFGNTTWTASISNANTLSVSATAGAPANTSCGPDFYLAITVDGAQTFVIGEPGVVASNMTLLSGRAGSTQWVQREGVRI
jgi:hypothetical protein